MGLFHAAWACRCWAFPRWLDSVQHTIPQGDRAYNFNNNNNVAENPTDVSSQHYEYFNITHDNYHQNTFTVICSMKVLLFDMEQTACPGVVISWPNALRRSSR